MRGFRGSRAAQQFFGRHGNHGTQDNHGHSHDQQQPSGPSVVSRLPEWMKTPETKAREAEEAKLRAQELANPKPQLKLVPIRNNPAPAAAAPQKAAIPAAAKAHLYDHPRAPTPSAPAAAAGKPQLRLIKNAPTQAPAAPKASAKLKAVAPKAVAKAKVAKAKVASPAKTKAKPAARAKAASGKRKPA